MSIGETSLAPLLRAVLDAPHDLEARLVYADVLQQRGDPRGEFIAQQIGGNEAGAAELLKRHRPAWTAFLRPAVSRGFRFRNGFIERITLKAEHLTLLPGFLDQEPIHEVRFRDLGTSAPDLAERHACTSRLSWLDLKQAHVSGKGFATLMTKGRWDRLWRIWAPSNGLGQPGVEGLCEAAPPKLRSLNLHGTRLHDTALRLLAGWSGIAKLEELNLRGNKLSDEAIAELLAAAPRLRWLGLPVVGPETLARLRAAAADRDTLASLIVTSVDEPTRSSLDEVLAGRWRTNPDYESDFDIPWP